MKIFLDTSSLVKLYHREVDTAELESFFSTKKVTAIFLSEILKIEFTSTIWKKVRTKEITVAAARRTLDLFGSDFIILLLQQAVPSLKKHGFFRQNMEWKV